MPRAVGIDLGTTYTLVAVLEEGEARVIPNAEGQLLTPSVVAFTQEGRPLVGQLAKRQAAANPERTVFSIKRRMGTDYKVKVNGKGYSPQEISSLILRKVKEDAEEHLSERIEKAVITVPAYFHDRQRQATKEAGLMAGLDIIRIINEPTAAALAYGLHWEDVHTVLVWDLGGGTFDVSILELEKGIFEVRAVSGDTWLGGDDFDWRLVYYLAEQYREAYGVDFSAEGRDLQRLREAAEKAKIDLSTKLSTFIYVPWLDGGSAGPGPLRVTLTREGFQGLTRDFLERMVAPTRQALADAGLEHRDIDRVILVGGATRMPAVRELARRLLGQEPYLSLNPDESVALGAAIQAGMLLGQIDKAVLLDVLPLSLGIETQGGLVARLIPRNTPLPTSGSRIFTTAADSQTSVDIHMLQGERELALDNISLGQFTLPGIPPLGRGRPRVEVAFDVDVDGLVQVSATDLLTENSERARVVSSQGLRPEEIERIVAEAEAHAEEDRERRERIEATLQAEHAIAAAEMATEEAWRCGEEERAQEIEGAVLRLKEALARGQPEEAKRSSQELRESLTGLYKKGGKGAKSLA